ncbi:tRNA lysidine(34) synthetase TilS [Paraglaciecola hydrolytica]|uniref:tRNA(Ile)-lysidine synthase n=1 Tax=Paraglaciecola hydrolytica TaxID=1799789 RepID=A0A148KMM8_9ALTE|nr:tRNA lysidine(34) synthetase TilS [Paraglaciecola hydrolytica]KXI27509.1 hypothetical protein AX660_22650 [Paraglaciecola hydrolytica]
MNLISELQTKLIPVLASSQHAIVVAYSGGVDSHVLLHCLSVLRKQGVINNPISAIHIHHGLSANADEWVKHCQQVCQGLGLSLQAAKVNVNKQARQSLEAVARSARYAKITELVPEHAVVLLAQHQDDQLETVLLQLKRGAGPKGLAGMAALAEQVSDTGKTVRFLRPLLSTSQADIMAYAKEQNLKWIEDESNQNTDFERNFLRHRILPALTKKWPELAKTAARSVQLCAEQQLLLDEISVQKLADIRAEQHSLLVPPLLEMSTAWLHQLVRVWLAESGISAPSQTLLHKLKPELLEAKADANPILQWGNWQFRRFDQRLFVIPAVEPIHAHTLVWQGQTLIKLPEPLGTLAFLSSAEQPNQSNSLLFDSDLGELKLYFGGYTQRFKPANSPFSKPLKQWYKEWKVPPWQRDKIVLFTQNKEVLALLMDGKWLLSHEYQSRISSLHTVAALRLYYQA